FTRKIGKYAAVVYHAAPSISINKLWRIFLNQKWTKKDLLLLSYHRTRHWARDRGAGERLGPKDGSPAGQIRCPQYRPDSLSAQDVLCDREAHHQPEFSQLPTFKQVYGANKILPRQRGEERDDAPRIATPGASVHNPDLTFFHSAEGLNLQ